MSVTQATRRPTTPRSTVGRHSPKLLDQPVPRTNRTLESYRRQFGDVFVDPSAGLILDVGAGDAGWPFERVRSRLVRLDLDYSRRPPDGPDAISGDVLGLPFASESFDTVISSWMMPYVADPQFALREMLRVANTGGRVMVHPTFRVLTRFVHPFPFAYEKIFSNAIGTRPTLVIEKQDGYSQSEWDQLAISIAASAKLVPNETARAIRRWYHRRLTNRLGVQLDHRAFSVTRAYLDPKSRHTHLR